MRPPAGILVGSGGVRRRPDKPQQSASLSSLYDTTASDRITGGDGDDALVGTDGDDLIAGGNGNDVLSGGNGNDVLLGGSGSDTIVGTSHGHDYVNGGAGIDQITFANAMYGVVVDLTAGSAIGSEIDELTLSGIENVAGGSGADTLIGDRLGNALDGGDGNDTLVGGAGPDILNGGPGSDTATYATSMTGVIVDLLHGTASGGDAEGDHLTGIENLTGSAFADHLIGDASSNALDGGQGNDTLSGMGGNDTLTGGLGNDSLSGGAGADTYVYAAGDGTDTITDASSYDSTVDVLRLETGLTADKVVIAHSGSDLTLSFTGQTGSIQLVAEDSGYGGVEQVVFGDGTTWTRLDLEAAYIAQQQAAGSTNIVGFDQRADAITGTAGADTLSGMGGNDTLTGGLGNDRLTGGSNSDTFVFDVGFGLDIITDFKAGANTDDLILFSTALFLNFAAVQAASVQSGGDVVITASPGNTITLQNVALSSLHIDDFRFV